MRLARTSFAYDEVRQFLTASSGSPLIESYLVQYLLVAFYSELEEHVKRIISDRISQIEDRKVACFVSKTHEQMLKRVKKSEINEVLQKFDCGNGDIISTLVGDINLQPYSDAIANRHLVTHQSGTTMTLARFANALPCAEAILDALQLALQPDP
jgi:ethanolamine utilization protein EutQ (cupin superfamily)